MVLLYFLHELYRYIVSFLFFNIFKFLLLRNLANLANNFQFHFSFFDIIISYDDRWMNFLTSYIFSNFVALLSFSNLICIACSCFDVVTQRRILLYSYLFIFNFGKSNFKSQNTNTKLVEIYLLNYKQFKFAKERVSCVLHYTFLHFISILFV